MKSQTRRIISISLLVILLVFLCVGVYRDSWRENHKNTFEIGTAYRIHNASSVPYLDTLCYVVLNKLLLVDSITLSIVNAPTDLSTAGATLVGFIDKNPFVDHNYILFVYPDELNTKKILFVAHEMLHILQYETRRLVLNSIPKARIFEGDTIYFDSIPYDKRTYEIEAEARAIGVMLATKKLIYKKVIW